MFHLMPIISKFHLILSLLRELLRLEQRAEIEHFSKVGSAASAPLFEIAAIWVICQDYTGNNERL